MTNDIWLTHDGRKIPVTDLGDQHLVNILTKMEKNRRGEDTLTPRFHNALMKAMYGPLVIEAVRRGLFEWNYNRKYLSPTLDAIVRKDRNEWMTNVIRGSKE